MTLVAISKKKPASDVAIAFDLGVRHFGENYVQELVQKKAACQNENLTWHFVGHLQSNKAKLISQHAHTIDAIHSAKLANKLSSQGASARLLVAVNLAGETQKSGCHPDELSAIIDAGQGTVSGLMTIPPAAANEKKLRELFSQLRTLADQHALSTLSMGMSADFEIAIEEGATEVRVGSAIFGARERFDVHASNDRS